MELTKLLFIMGVKCLVSFAFRLGAERLFGLM